MHDRYESPLNSRYASREMQALFSADRKFTTWRRLWIALAEAEQELGLPITDQQLDQLRQHVSDINYEVAEAREREVRHDVMAHVYAYGQQCPAAQGILHLGATSCYVGDNTDLILMYEGLELIRRKLANVLAALTKFALEHRDLPTLGFTHYQPAQLTTVGKRACLWMQELEMDYWEIEHRLAHKRLRGAKGTTGTQASFMELFEGDSERVKRLDALVAQKMGFDSVFPVTGQTYPRKEDTLVLNVLAGIAQSAHKFSNDVRLLQSMKEIEEPFEKKQIGSSAMAYKRNPMRCERMASLARYVTVTALNPALTASEQWFERTLDDSANKRISVPEAFLATDAILSLMLNVSAGLVVYPKVIAARLEAELPFMATENILMDAVKRGGDRQQLHERIRTHSMEAARRVKAEGLPNDLLDRIAADPAFGMSREDLASALDARLYVGRAPQQVEEYVAHIAADILEPNREFLGAEATIQV